MDGTDVRKKIVVIDDSQGAIRDALKFLGAEYELLLIHVTSFPVDSAYEVIQIGSDEGDEPFESITTNDGIIHTNIFESIVQHIRNFNPGLMMLDLNLRQSYKQEGHVSFDGFTIFKKCPQFLCMCTSDGDLSLYPTNFSRLNYAGPNKFESDYDSWSMAASIALKALTT